MPEISWLAEDLSASQEGLCSIQLFIYLFIQIKWGGELSHRVELQVNSLLSSALVAGKLPLGNNPGFLA